jgi:hypothetical protein
VFTGRGVVQMIDIAILPGRDYFTEIEASGRDPLPGGCASAFSLEAGWYAEVTSCSQARSCWRLVN